MSTVIIVPGIGGCDLHVGFGLIRLVRVWLDYAVMLAGGWRFLGLAPDGMAPQLPLAPSLTPGAALGSYYGILSRQLESRGWRVIDAKLDWRQTIQRNGERLASLIIEAAEAGTIRLVCHSRGGLVARKAIAVLKQSVALPADTRLVGIGVPHDGSLQAAQLLAGIDHTKLLLYAFLEIAPTLLVGGWPKGTLNEIIATWPAAYELLPRPGCSWLPPDQVEDLYNPATWTASGVSLSAPWLAAAAAAWTALPVPGPDVDWIDVVGVGVTTPIGLAPGLSLRAPAAYQYTAHGDGTVPAAAATLPGRRRITTPTSHGQLPQDGRVIDWIDRVLRSGLTEDVTIGGDVLR